METKQGRRNLLSLKETPLIVLLKSHEVNVHTEKDILLLIGAWVDHKMDQEAEKSSGKERPSGDRSDNPLFGEILMWLQRGSVAGQTRKGKSDNKDKKGGSDDEETNVSGHLEWKMTLTYEAKLKEKMEPYMDYVRFPMMSAPQLLEIDNTGFVPQKLLTEAYRHHFMLQTKGYKGSKKNVRFRGRMYTLQEWDPDKKGAGISLNNDNKTVTKSQSCSHTSVITKNGISRGKASWELLLNQNAGCYSCVGICERDFDINSALLGVASNSYGYAMYPGMGNVNGTTRKQTGSVVQSGVVVRVELDMSKGEMVVYESNTERARFDNIKKDSTYYFALTICHNSPPESYTLKTI